MISADVNIGGDISVEVSLDAPSSSTVAGVFNYAFGNTDSVEITSALQALSGTYTQEMLDNVTSVVYTLNDVVVTLPFTVAVGDKLEVDVTRTDSGSDSTVTISGAIANVTSTFNSPPPFTGPLEYDPLAFWDITDLSSITKDGSNFVSQVDDQSTNNNHIAQALGSSQPIYNASEFLDFDGSDDYMIKQLTGFNSASDFTFFIRVYFEKVGQNVYLKFFTSDNGVGGGGTFLQTTNTGGRPDFRFWVTGNYFTQAEHSVNFNEWMTIMVENNNTAGTTTMTLNGTETKTASANASSNIDAYLHLSGYLGRQLDGRIKGAVIYDKLLTSEQQTEVNNYFNAL